jgi:hypothetical protein
MDSYPLDDERVTVAGRLTGVQPWGGSRRRGSGSLRLPTQPAPPSQAHGRPRWARRRQQVTGCGPFPDLTGTVLSIAE